MILLSAIRVKECVIWLFALFYPVYQRIVYTGIFEFVGADSVGACIVIFLSAVLLFECSVWRRVADF